MSEFCLRVLFLFTSSLQDFTQINRDKFRVQGNDAFHLLLEVRISEFSVRIVTWHAHGGRIANLDSSQEILTNLELKIKDGGTVHKQ